MKRDSCRVKKTYLIVVNKNECTANAVINLMIIFPGLSAPGQTQTWRRDLRHDDLAGLVHFIRLFVAQDDFAQR